METRDECGYARSGDISMAYVVDGARPPDIVFAHGTFRPAARAGHARGAKQWRLFAVV